MNFVLVVVPLLLGSILFMHLQGPAEGCHESAHQANEAGDDKHPGEYYDYHRRELVGPTPGGEGNWRIGGGQGGNGGGSLNVLVVDHETHDSFRTGAAARSSRFNRTWWFAEQRGLRLLWRVHSFSTRINHVRTAPSLHRLRITSSQQWPQHRVDGLCEHISHRSASPRDVRWTLFLYSITLLRCAVFTRYAVFLRRVIFDVTVVEGLAALHGCSQL